MNAGAGGAGGQRRRGNAERAARVGLIGKGVMYLLLGVVVGQLGFGTGGEDASQQGAFSTLARQPFGALMLGLVALGLGCYALWRGWQAVVGIDGDSSLPEPLLRVTLAARAVTYSVLTILAVRELAGAGAAGGGEESLSARLLAQPGGVVLVVAVGCVLAVVGVAQWREAISREFLDELGTGGMPAFERRIISVLGVAGHGARGTAFGLVGAFLIRAALTHDPEVGVGLDAALQEVREAPMGIAAVLIVAAGLAIYGIFCFVQTHAARVHSMD